MAIVTSVIPGRSSGWFGRMMAVWMARWWWTVALAVGIPALLGVIVSTDYFFVALVVALASYSLVVFIVYATYATRPGSETALWDRQVTFGDTAMTIDYINPVDDGSNRRVRVPYSTITRIDYRRRGFAVEWGDGPWDYIKLPDTAFASPAQSRSAISLIHRRVFAD